MKTILGQFFEQEIQPLIDELDENVCTTCEGRTYTMEYDVDELYARPCMDCEDTWATRGEVLSEFDLINLK